MDGPPLLLPRRRDRVRPHDQILRQRSLRLTLTDQQPSPDPTYRLPPNLTIHYNRVQLPEE